jgi:predicted Zn-dependent peptidase
MTKLAPLRAAAALTLFGWACGEAEDASRRLSFDPQPLCDGAGVSCINAGTESTEIEGIRVIHKYVPGHPLVSMRVQFAAETTTGLEHWSEGLALALLAYAGPARFDSAEWSQELLELSSTINTTFGIDYQGSSALAPAPNWRIVWELMIEGATQPRSFGYELENRRGVYQNNFVVERDDPDSAAGVEAWNRLFGDHVYNLPRNSQSALAAVQTWDIEPAWRRLLTKDRMLVIVVGDVELDALVAAVSESLGHLPAELPPSGVLEVASAPRPQPIAAVLPYPDSPTWHVRAYFKGPLATSPDIAPLGVALEVLAQRLFDRVRVERGLAYSTGTSLAMSRHTFGRFWLSSEAPGEALPLAREVIAELKAAGPTEQELAAVKSALLTQLVAGNVSASSLSYTLGDWELTFGSRLSIDEYASAVETVTATDVSLSLDTYLRDVAIAAAGGGSALDATQLNALFVSP